MVRTGIDIVEESKAIWQEVVDHKLECSEHSRYWCGWMGVSMGEEKQGLYHLSPRREDADHSKSMAFSLYRSQRPRKG